MSAIEWEALIIWDETLADYKRGHEVQTLQLLAVLPQFLGALIR